MRFLRTVWCMEGQWEFLLLKAEFIIRLYEVELELKNKAHFFVDLSPDVQDRLSERLDSRINFTEVFFLLGGITYM